MQHSSFFTLNRLNSIINYKERFASYKYALFQAHREIIFTYDPNRKEKGNDERYMVGKQNTEKVKVICEMEVTLNMIGGKYKPLIIEYLIK